MALLAEIGQHLDDEGRGTQGTDIFLGDMPDSPANVITVYEYLGAEPTQCMGSSGTAPSVEHPRIHVLVRNSTYNGAVTVADAVFDDLHWFKGTLSGVVYKLIQASQRPFSLGRDEDNNARLACNYRIMKDPS